jgi:hypothetical protein
MSSSPPSGDKIKDVDMSAQAITRRLRQVSELRDLCLSLGRAGEALRKSEPPSKPKK